MIGLISCPPWVTFLVQQHHGLKILERFKFSFFSSPKSIPASHGNYKPWNVGSALLPAWGFSVSSLHVLYGHWRVLNQVVLVPNLNQSTTGQKNDI